MSRFVVTGDLLPLIAASLPLALTGASRGRFCADKAKALQDSAKQSLALSRQDAALDLLIGTMIAQFEFFEKQLAELDLHIQRLFSRMEHPIKTIPGIGSITGPLIAAELGDLRRFENRRPIHAILAYAGMDPRVRKSGRWSGKIKMSKRGSTALRTPLYQAASMARLDEPRLAEIYNRHKHHYMRTPTPPIEISRRPFSTYNAAFREIRRAGF